jgi:hypothetical protein
MESRMQGNLHVRFGGGDGETYGRNAIRRPIPTLPFVLHLPTTLQISSVSTLNTALLCGPCS